MDISTLLTFVGDNIFWVQVTCLLLIFGSVTLLSSSKRIRGKIAATLPTYIPHHKTRLVYTLSETNLQKGIKGIKQAKPFLGYFTSERIVLADGEGDLRKFMPQDTTLTLIETKGLSSQIPLFIRLNHDGDRIYIACKKTYLGGWDDTQTQTLFNTLAKRFPHHTLDQYKDLHEPNRYLVAVLFAACLAGIGLVCSVFLDDAKRDAPQVLAELSNGHVVAFSRKILYELTEQGGLVTSIDLASIGLSEGVSDAQATKTGELLVADSASGFVKRCRPDPWRCKPLAQSMDSKQTQALNAFAIAHNDSDGQLFVADSSRHRVFALTAKGEYLDTVLDANDLCFPNKVWIRNNRLLVVNTNWHNILEYDLGYWDEPTNRWSTVKQGREQISCPDPDDATIKFFHREAVAGHNAIAYGDSAKGRVWPMDAGRDDNGYWWVLNAKNGMKDADLVKLHPDGKFFKVVLAGTDPVGLLVRDDDVLVADMDGPRILQVLTGGEYFNDFGDARFMAKMSAIAESEQRQTKTYLSGLALIGLPLVLAFGLLLLLSDRRLRWVPTA